MHASFIQFISFSLQLLSAVTDSDDICQNESDCFKVLSGYLYFSVCIKQLVVPIHFTGLPNELREIIGSLKMRAKRSNAAARGLVSPKKWKWKKGGHMIKCLSTEWGRAGRETIWLSVRTHGLFCARSVRPDLEPSSFPSGPPTHSIST